MRRPTSKSGLQKSPLVLRLNKANLGNLISKGFFETIMVKKYGQK